MPEPASIGLFTLAALALLVTPGPAVTYVVTRSVTQGRAAGLVSSLGLGLGGLVHVAAAAFGVSALLASSATAFATLKYAGAAYLVWLGIQRLRQTDAAEAAAVRAAQPLARVFWEGALVNALNPKAALFFLAFLPQFVSPRGPAVPQLLFLGLLFVTMAAFTDSAWALASGSVAVRLRTSPALARSGRYLAGTTYIGLGLATAASGARHR